MKAFALVLLCVAAAQGRSTGFKDAKWSSAEAGAAPWLVHVRLSKWTSGLLSTCAGSIIDQRWVLTSASCVEQSRFIWTRYGAVNVIQPELVLETGSTDVNVAAHPTADLAVISLNRDVHFTSNIAAPVVASEDAEVPSSGTFCAYGQNENNGPGEKLRCVDVSLESDGEGGIIATGGEASSFDVGTPLVVDGVQYGVLVDPAAGKFLNPAAFREWIETTAGITLPTAEKEEEEEEEEEDEEEEEEEDEEEEEEDEDEEEEEEVDAVRFVN